MRGVHQAGRRQKKQNAIIADIAGITCEKCSFDIKPMHDRRFNSDFIIGSLAGNASQRGWLAGKY